MTEVDEPEIRLDLGSDHINERLADLIQNYRVEAERTAPKLGKKPSSS